MRVPTLDCRLQNGTTYNAYLIFGEKTALVDASHEKFRGLFMQTLKEQLAKAGRSIDYVLVSHTEPDHSGAPVRVNAAHYILGAPHAGDSCP